MYGTRACAHNNYDVAFRKPLKVINCNSSVPDVWAEIGSCVDNFLDNFKMQLIARSLLAAVCHACLLLTLVFYLPGTSKKTVAAETHRTNVVVLNGSESK